ncbi:MAG: AAA family ATPase [Planctomycetes bacterium]|nr:AAA family ATPase [Planctomycetota bacterium]
MPGTTFLRSLTLSNVFGVCGELTIQPCTNLIVLAGPNHCGKTKLLDAIWLALSDDLGNLGPEICNRYSTGSGGPMLIRLELETDVLVPTTDGHVSSAYSLNEPEFLRAPVVMTLGNEYGCAVGNPAKATLHKRSMSIDRDPHNHPWVGRTPHPGAHSTLVAYVRYEDETDLPAEASAGSDDVGGEIVRFVWNVQSDQEAQTQASSIPRKHLVDMDDAAAAKTRNYLPATLPAHISIAVTRDGTKGNVAELDTYDLQRRRRLDGVRLSNGNRRALHIQRALDNRPAAMVLIDEVERGLHPSQQIRLLHELREASADRTIIVTTHSETILRHTRLNELLVVDLDEQDTHVTTRVRAPVARGVSGLLKREFGGLATIHGRVPAPLLLVEGPSDKWYIENYVLEGEWVDWPKLDSLEVSVGHGSQIVQYSRWLANNGVAHICLLDSDPGGDEAAGKLGKTGKVVVVRLPWEGVIEDLYFDATHEIALRDQIPSDKQAAFNESVVKARKPGTNLTFRQLAVIFKQTVGEEIDKWRLADVLAQAGGYPRNDRAMALRNTLGNAVDAWARL